MDKLDLKKQYKHLYKPPSDRVTLVEVPEFQFLMIDGCIEPGFSPAESQLRFETFQEGFCIQLLNVGPYDQEKRSLDQMEAFARENGYVYHGKHHEIYLGDPRRADPDKLKTVLRQPVKSLA